MAIHPLGTSPFAYVTEVFVASIVDVIASTIKKTKYIIASLINSEANVLEHSLIHLASILSL